MKKGIIVISILLLVSFLPMDTFGAILRGIVRMDMGLTPILVVQNMKVNGRMGKGTGKGPKLFQMAQNMRVDSRMVKGTAKEPSPFLMVGNRKGI